MKFKRWILQYKNEISPFGDLAWDIALDKTWPNKNTFKELNNYLLHKNASYKVLDVFRCAWYIYKNN